MVLKERYFFRVRKFFGIFRCGLLFCIEGEFFFGIGVDLVVFSEYGFFRILGVSVRYGDTAF